MEIPPDLPVYMSVALGKFNEYILEYHEAMTKAQNSVHSIAALFYAICNQEKEKRNRLLNNIAKYGQKIAHETRNKALVLYNKTRKAQRQNNRIITSPRGALLQMSTDELCGKGNVGPRKAKLIAPLPQNRDRKKINKQEHIPKEDKEKQKKITDYQIHQQKEIQRKKEDGDSVKQPPNVEREMNDIIAGKKESTDTPFSDRKEERREKEKQKEIQRKKEDGDSVKQPPNVEREMNDIIAGKKESTDTPFSNRKGERREKEKQKEIQRKKEEGDSVRQPPNVEREMNDIIAESKESTDTTFSGRKEERRVKEKIRQNDQDKRQKEEENEESSTEQLNRKSRKRTQNKYPKDDEESSENSAEEENSTEQKEDKTKLIKKKIVKSSRKSHNGNKEKRRKKKHSPDEDEDEKDSTGEEERTKNEK